jgi:hypothetical protein
LQAAKQAAKNGIAARQQGNYRAHNEPQVLQQTANTRQEAESVDPYANP